MTSTPPARSINDQTIKHIYVHIPFCARICPYCAFYKELLDRSQTERFCQALAHEIGQQANARKIVPETIFWGGGTPTALTIPQLKTLFRGFHEHIDLSKVREWTTEANPGSVSAAKARLLHESGINRISLGVQSWDDDLLKVLGREHNAQQAEASFRILRAAHFKNINIDLMFGLPGQSVAQWQATLAKTIELEPEHISAYCLTYEEDTDFFLRHSRGELRSNNDLEAELFELAISMLEGAGYEHYEISNYARPGFASSHNRSYWAGENYLGIGPSAFSTVDLQRWQNVPNYREYTDFILSEQSAVGSVEELTPEMKRTEFIALSLRTRDGVSAETLKPWQKETDEFLALGLLERSNGSFLLTRAGKSLADSVAGAFL